MEVYKKALGGLPMMMERKNLTPHVSIFMISIQNDPAKFPMVYKKEFGGWIFVDKMTPIEFKEIESEISRFIETIEIN